MTDAGHSDDADTRPGPRGKVARLLETYDLPELGDELEARWTDDSSDRMSLRELARYFNERLVRKALREQAVTTLDGEAENYYRLLTADDVSSGSRIQAENQLAQAGVDVDRLRSSFVSRQAIHTYLRSERSAAYDREDSADAVRARVNAIRRLKRRLAAVGEQAIAELRRRGRIHCGDVHVSVLVQVYCEECDSSRTAGEFLTGGGCDCAGSDR